MTISGPQPAVCGGNERRVASVSNGSVPPANKSKAFALWHVPDGGQPREVLRPVVLEEPLSTWERLPGRARRSRSAGGRYVFEGSSSRGRSR